MVSRICRTSASVSCDAALGRDAHLRDDFSFGPDAVDVLQRDDHALVGRNIDAGYTSHSLLHVGESCGASGCCPRVRWRPAQRTENIKTARVSPRERSDQFGARGDDLAVPARPQISPEFSKRPAKTVPAECAERPDRLRTAGASTRPGSAR